ncbi:S-adenosyl-L-methionine-dependent methyltransferase [Arabidopsis thaliana x Arabidopsis arenosa]|uniref:S-adenosyl-L-methionine-dependent methyltransferase n=1 Tax=Arabidopsis thaliana x Arabidopsis arenosa TaxID=1240361 RepID=A0A8T1Y173_9BRAS|nr:S-adenosyl-L-methionine-dependent methyltransferase [Arabidopsis thaliana x Arabidopsis arenosa]
MTNHHQEYLTTYPKPGPTNKEQEKVDEKMMSLQMQALGITNSLAFPMVFKAALELGVLDTIVAVDDGLWLSSSEIAFGLPTKPTNPKAPILLDRMLRLLVSHSILKCRIVETGENDLTGKTQRHLLVPDQDLFNFRRPKLIIPCTIFEIRRTYGYFMMFGRDNFENGRANLSESDESLPETPYLHFHRSNDIFPRPILKFRRSTIHFMRNGRGTFAPGRARFGDGREGLIFEYTDVAIGCRTDRCFAARLSRSVAQPIGASLFFRSVMPIGCTTDRSLTAAPSVQVVMETDPSVLANAPFYPGVEHVSGDMFIEVPKGDAIFMKWILHDWNDEDCVKILKNCWKSLPEKGKVIIVDMVTPSEPKSDDLFSNIVFGMDMLVLTQCSGGKERSFSQFEALASASGFLKCEISALAYTYSVIEFHK